MTRTDTSRSKRPSHRARTAGAGREALSHERIAGAALQLIDEQGLDALSMRALGTALGVQAMALYHHFGSKGEVLDAVVELLAREIELAPRDSLDAMSRLRLALRSFRRIAVTHPHAFILIAARRFNSDSAFAVYERILEAFADTGLDARDSARWFRLLGGFASGAGLAYVASLEQVPDATPLRLERDSERIPFPHVAAVAPHLRLAELEDVFEFGLDVLFEALRSRTAAPPGRARSRRRQPS